LNTFKNKKQYKRIVGPLIALVAILVTSCFEPSGTVFTKVPAPDYSGVRIDLSTASDTIFIDQPTLLYVNTETGSRKVFSIVLYLNDTVVYNDYSTFWIEPRSHAKGPQPLRLVMTMATGDGSLADKVGVSSVEVTHNYVAVIDASPMTPKITAFDSTGGTMTVRWEKYERSDFQHYTLYKMCSSNGYSFDDCQEIQINSRGQNFWNDVDYVGGAVRYRVNVTATHELYGQIRSYYWILETRYTLDGKRPVLHWSKLLYYSNAKNIVVNYGASTLGVSDTLYTDATDLGGGEIRSDHITITSAVSSQNYSFNIESYRGKLFFNRALPYRYNPAAKVYYSFNGYMQVLDDSLELVTTGIPPWLSMSAGGTHLITGGYDGSVITMREIDPVTLETAGTIYQGASVANSYSGVSDNGIVVLSKYPNNYGLQLPDYHVVFQANGRTSGMAISPAGTYLMSNDSIYKFNGSVYQGWMNISPGNDYSLFIDDNTLITISPGGLMKRIVAGAKNTSSFNLDNVFPYSLEYDPVSQRLLIWTNTGAVIVNPENGNVVVRFSYYCHLVNGKVFFSEYSGSSFIWLPYSEFE